MVAPESYARTRSSRGGGDGFRRRRALRGLLAQATEAARTVRRSNADGRQQHSRLLRRRALACRCVKPQPVEPFELPNLAARSASRSLCAAAFGPTRSPV